MRKYINKFFINATTNTYLQLIRYGLVGGIAFIVDYSTLFFLTEHFCVKYLISSAFAFALGLIVNYIMSTLWVFSTHNQSKKIIEFVIFTIIGVFGLGLNELIMYICTDITGRHYMISKLISTIIVFFWNFFARKIILFNK